MAVNQLGGNIAGIDTHKDTLHVAVVSAVGGELADREFPATSAGYRAVTEFLDGHSVGAVGVECTSSYGRGITGALQAAGLPVAEVYGGRKDTKRIKGKSDPLDAVAAARAVLAGDGIATPKDERTNIVRTLHVARRSGVKARTAAINQIKAILIGAPGESPRKVQWCNSIGVGHGAGGLPPSRTY